MAGVPPIALPSELDGQRRLGPDWARWLDGLPRRFADILDEWELRRDGEELWHGFCSLVAPVVTGDGVRAVLKLHFDGDDESLHEALTLQHWQGQGTVRLFRADPRRRAMLLERLERRDLMEVWDLPACEVVADLYPKIHLPALPQLATLTSYVSRWLDELLEQPQDIPIPPRYREQALSLGRELVADDASVGRIVHGDLHYMNVLAAPPDVVAERGEWLAIDPKPMSGDPHYEIAPMLWNRFDELGDNLRDGIRRRFHTIVDAAGLDEDRARDWVVVRMVHNASWDVIDGDPDEEWLTTCFTIAKAVQE